MVAGIASARGRRPRSSAPDQHSAPSSTSMSHEPWTKSGSLGRHEHPALDGDRQLAGSESARASAAASASSSGASSGVSTSGEAQRAAAAARPSGAAGDHKRPRGSADRRGQVLDEVEQALLGPVQVIEGERPRRAARLGGEQLAHRARTSLRAGGRRPPRRARRWLSGEDDLAGFGSSRDAAPAATRASAGDAPGGARTRRRRSASGRKMTSSPYGAVAARGHPPRRPACARTNSSASRVLPCPGRATTLTDSPVLQASAQAARRRSGRSSSAAAPRWGFLSAAEDGRRWRPSGGAGAQRHNFPRAGQGIDLVGLGRLVRAASSPRRRHSPDAAACSSRAATLTASPVTNACPRSVAATTSPVSTPMRTPARRRRRRATSAPRQQCLVAQLERPPAARIGSSSSSPGAETAIARRR